MKTIRWMGLLGLLIMPLALSAQSSAEPDPNARTVMPSADAAQVSGLLGRPNQELFGVRFVGLNGRNIPPRDSMWLAPGVYTLTVTIDASHVRRPPTWGQSRPRNRIREDDRNQELRDNQIQVEVEAGKTYEIRARYNPDNEDSPYSLVVHRIRDN